MNKYDDIKRFLEKSKTEDIDYKEISESSVGNGMTGSMNKWSLIKQVSASEEAPSALENGRTTLPTPQAISAEEFERTVTVAHDLLNTPVSTPSIAESTPINTLSAEIPATGSNLMEALRESLPPVSPPLAAPQAPTAQHSAAILHAQSVTPDSAGSLLDSVKNALPVQPPVQAPQPQQRPQPQPAYSAPAAPVNAAVAPARTQPVVAPVPVSAPPPPGAQFRQMFKQKAPLSAGAYLHRDTPLQPLLEMIASCR